MKAILAINKLGYIGKDNKLPWECRDDLKHFKEMTLNSKILVGRKTFIDLPKLKNRDLIVIGNGYHTLEDGLSMKPDWIIGGLSIYENILHLCDELHISIIDDYTIGDTICPNLNNFKGDIFTYYFKTN